jgi:two-component system, cell cycle response regulator DivK
MSPSPILVIDDHPDSRQICEIILSRHGYRTLSAADGARGLDLARTEGPAVIVLDIGLPIVDGWAVIDELKADPRTAQVPVIVYTAHTLAGNQERAEQLGCAGFLGKPCSPLAIVEMVSRLLPPPPAGEAVAKPA